MFFEKKSSPICQKQKFMLLKLNRLILPKAENKMFVKKYSDAQAFEKIISKGHIFVSTANIFQWYLLLSFSFKFHVKSTTDQVSNYELLWKLDTF